MALYVLFFYPNANIANNVNAIIEVDSTNEFNILQNEEIENCEWKLEIPKIGLSATIAEGTTDEILNQYIGHFENTNKDLGNIALAAHNRGYNVNYFAKLKELEIGDEINYTFRNSTRKYKISSKNIIKDTDVEVLEQTNENMLTLITCVENKPNLRRCLTAMEIKDKKGN